MPSETDKQGWIALATRGQMSWTEVAERLLLLEHAESTPDRPDTDRLRRCGFGEVVFGEGKSPTTIVDIASRLLESGRQTEVLVTRVANGSVPSIAGSFAFSRFDSLGRTLRLSHRPLADPEETTRGAVVVLTAGSTDLPVAREALETLRWMGIAAELLTDVGVAGPYRLLPHLLKLRKANALVVCAGMEGALASVVGGLVACPVIAVPTSVGYGVNLSGITTLLSMLSSCAAGVTVVNIDAGFKGGYVAGLIATKIEQR